jgi:hypothetical protein
MVHGPAYYPSKGACIYCAATDVPLKDEHIVPYSLGGTHVLRAASCAACEDTTKRFEQKVARDLWGDARASFNAPTRRKKQRKNRIEMPDAVERQRSELIEATEYPGGFVFYKMGTCGYLRGLPETTDTSDSWQLVMIDDDARRNAFIKKYGRNPVLSFRHVPDAFGRLLAKIGYCQVLTAVDPGDFRPLVLPYIKGEKKNVSYIVGSKDAMPEPATGYRLTTLYSEHEDKLILMAEVRLYSNTHAPAYHVVVGDVSGTQEQAHVKTKLASAK